MKAPYIKAYDIVGYALNGELLCPNCYNEKYAQMDENELRCSGLVPIFACDANSDDICDKCNEVIS